MAYLCRLSSARPAVQQAVRSVVGQTSKRHYWPIRRYDPFEEASRKFDQLFRELDRVSNFGSFFSPVLRRTLPIETQENGQRIFRIEVDLPDFKAEDIQVTVKKGEVIIRAKSEHNESNIKQNREFNYRYTLHEDADVAKVRSFLKTDGRLIIEAPLPQLESKQTDKEIPIKKE